MCDPDEGKQEGGGPARGSAHGIMPTLLAQQSMQNGKLNATPSNDGGCGEAGDGNTRAPVAQPNHRVVRLSGPNPVEPTVVQSEQQGKAKRRSNIWEVAEPPPPEKSTKPAAREVDIEPTRRNIASRSTDVGYHGWDLSAQQQGDDQPPREFDFPAEGGFAPGRDRRNHPGFNRADGRRDGSNCSPTSANRRENRQVEDERSNIGAGVSGKRTAEGLSDLSVVHGGRQNDLKRQRQRTGREGGALRTLPPDAEVVEVRFSLDRSIYSYPVARTTSSPLRSLFLPFQTSCS